MMPELPKILKPKEDSIQQALVQWAAYAHEVSLIHIPNQGKRSFSYGRRLKKMGLRPGFPDLMLLAKRHIYGALFIELKADHSCKATLAQKGWIHELKQAGYRAEICYGLDEAKALIDEYLAL